VHAIDVAVIQGTCSNNMMFLLAEQEPVLILLLISNTSHYFLFTQLVGTVDEDAINPLGPIQFHIISRQTSCWRKNSMSSRWLGKNVNKLISL
jgi:hypothetical protein